MTNKILTLLMLFVLVSQSIMATDTKEEAKFEALANKYIAEHHRNESRMGDEFGRA